MGASILDHLLARAVRQEYFFKHGWGNREKLETLLERGVPFERAQPAQIRWSRERRFFNIGVRHGRFSSPRINTGLPFAKECASGYVELVRPLDKGKSLPLCIHFAATGDEGFARRRFMMALPLARRGIASLILENAYYGLRRPQGQIRWSLRKVEDLWAMAIATVEEGRALLETALHLGFQRVALTGVSMGGFMAAAVGALSQRDVAIVPCISPHSGAPVFTEGLMSQACEWKVLENEMNGRRSARRTLRRLLHITDLRALPPPVRPDAAIIIGARHDGFVPPNSTRLLHRHWPGSELRWVDTGHAGAFLFHRPKFHQAVQDALARLTTTPRAGARL